MAKPYFFRCGFNLRISSFIACLGLCLLHLSSAHGSSTTVLAHHWQLPAKPSLGQTAVLNLQIAAWKRPTADDLQVACDPEIDLLKPITWQWQGFSWRGHLWQTKVQFCFHAPGEDIQAQVTFLPTEEKFSLSEVAIVLPEQQLSPIWLAPIDDLPRSRYRLIFFCRSAIILLVFCSCLISFKRVVQRWHHNQQLQRLRRRLDSATAIGSAEQIHQVLLGFFISQAKTFPSRDLHRLALYWRYHQSPNAWLSPSLHYLADHLERLRFQNSQKLPCPSLASYGDLAAFIMQHYQQE